MSLYNGPPRPGARGGRDQFNWENVKSDKDRSYYLGHSVKASTGRWQNGRDILWYTREKESDDAAAQAAAELRAVQAMEQQLIDEALGLKPKVARPAVAPQLNQNELRALTRKGHDQDEEPQEADPDRIKGFGYGPNAVAGREEEVEVMPGVNMGPTGDDRPSTSRPMPAAGKAESSRDLPPPPPGAGGALLSEAEVKRLRKEARRAEKAAKKEKKADKKSKKAKKTKHSKHSKQKDGHRKRKRSPRSQDGGSSSSSSGGDDSGDELPEAAHKRPRHADEQRTQLPAAAASPPPKQPDDRLDTEPHRSAPNTAPTRERYTRDERHSLHDRYTRDERYSRDERHSHDERRHAAAKHPPPSEAAAASHGGDLDDRRRTHEAAGGSSRAEHASHRHAANGSHVAPPLGQAPRGAVHPEHPEDGYAYIDEFLEKEQLREMGSYRSSDGGRDARYRDGRELADRGGRHPRGEPPYWDRYPRREYDTEDRGYRRNSPSHERSRPHY